MRLSIVIVSYNSKEFLKKCLDSVFSSNFKDLEVIVVDNASEDETADELKKSKYNLKFIINSKNLGFSKANNIGIKKSSGEYVLFLNPDTIVSSKTFSTLIDFMNKNKNAGALTCKVVLPSGKLDDSCHRGFPTPWNAFCYFSGFEKLFPHSKLLAGYHLGWKDYSKTHEIDAAAGSFLFVRKKAGEDIGWWDEDYFFYGEDLDFCYKLKEKGWKIFYVPNVSILHYKGISSGIKSQSKHLSSADLETRKNATIARFDAMKIFYNKHYINKYPKLITWLVFKAINLKLSISLRNI